MSRLLDVILVLLILVLLIPAAVPVQAAGQALSWNTFLGSADEDGGFKVAVDPAGNIYVSGSSDAAWGSPLRAYTSRTDTFVAKIGSNGVLQWNTFLGGDGNDESSGIVVDSGGNVYVTGTSSQTWGAPLAGFLGDYDAFVVKLSGNGSIVWNTFVGGTNWDFGNGITADAAGNVYITGYSFGTWGVPVRSFSTGAPPDAFAAKLNGSGALTWSTFLGGTGDDFAHGIATDPALNVYVAGYSSTAWGSPVRQFTPSGWWHDGFAVKLNSSGVLQWNTFLGGSARDYCFSIAADRVGNSYVAGQSFATWGTPVRAYSSNGDGFVARIDSGGNLDWNTFLGGNATDSSNSIAINDGSVCVAGTSSVAWGSPLRAYTASDDAFVSSLSSGGVLQWNAFVGGGGIDAGDGVAVDAGRNIYACGISDATWGSPVRPFSPGMTAGPEPHPTFDAFVAKIPASLPSITSFTPSSGGSGTIVTITGRNFLGATAVNFGGVPAASYIIDSATRITAMVGSGATGKVAVTAAAGTGASATNFSFISQVTSHGSSISGGTAAPPQGPVSLPTVSVKSAALSAAKVAPGAPVTVTASVVNTGAVNGSSIIRVYVDGELENSQGVTVNSGSTVPVTFTVNRNEPGTYSVYVGGVQAGSFVVNGFEDSNAILYVSGALLSVAFVLGLLFIVRRRPKS